MAAEKAVEKIISLIQPTSDSEETRKRVIDYMQRLLTGYLGCQVFSYGSVPLKTYLPDGDIDLTAFGGANVEDSFANDMVSVLKGEENNKDAEFVVKNVQIIRAEVKLVKCTVQNIVVDISFNQIGGLCTLCFLERVDRLIGRDHLFKRSIILIKAWCYYESRILGSYHGLIATYALETLVLYIFHRFHSTLSGPLAVLYKFLEYFSKFDWDNYCVSLTGPVHISSLPEIVVEVPEKDKGDLLLNNDFLRDCVQMFSVPPKVGDTNPTTFQQKHLNVVDPLREHNNLGRSISKGNFSRIKSAFMYGAQQLERILEQPENNIADEIFDFFSNILKRHKSGQRRDIQDLGFHGAFSVSETVDSESVSPHRIVTPGNFEHNPLQDGLNNGIATSKVSDDLSKISLRSNAASVSPLAIAHQTPHVYSSNSVLDIGMVNYGTQQSERNENKVSAVGKCESLNSLSDLLGDYETHFRCLLFGRQCYKFAFGGPFLSMAPPPFPIPPSHFRLMNTLDAVQHSSQVRRIGIRAPVPVFYPVNPQTMPGMTITVGEMPKPQGTGTYIPSMNWHPPAMIGRNQAPASYRNSCQHTTPNVFPVHGMNGSSDIHQRRVNPHVNESNPHVNNIPPATPLQSPALSISQTSNQGPPTMEMQRPSMNHDRPTRRKSYRLKDDKDFPPLSS